MVSTIMFYNKRELLAEPAPAHAHMVSDLQLFGVDNRMFDVLEVQLQLYPLTLAFDAWKQVTTPDLKLPNSINVCVYPDIGVFARPGLFKDSSNHRILL